MKFNEVKSFAKINLALNITGKNSILHKCQCFRQQKTGKIIEYKKY